MPGEFGEHHPRAFFTLDRGRVWHEALISGIKTSALRAKILRSSGAWDWKGDDPKKGIGLGLDVKLIKAPDPYLDLTSTNWTVSNLDLLVENTFNSLKKLEEV